jgi:hypothetical protein
MDWIACHALPPDRPTRLRIAGYAVTWLDLALVGYATAIAIGLSLWDGQWWLWLPATALCMALAWIAWDHER